MGKRIAVTGGIGSGKSIVLQCIRELGYPVFSCDEIYKEISRSSTYLDIIKEVFPSCVQNDVLDRKELSEIVFNNQAALEKLNQISHPLILRELYSRMDNSNSKFVFAEVPLLFEAGLEKDFHETIYVKRNIEDRIQSVILRDHTDRESVEKRIERQFNPNSAEGQIRLQNPKVHVLENNEDIERIEVWLKKFLSTIA